MRRFVLGIIVPAVCATASLGERVDPAFARDPIGIVRTAAAPRLADTAPADPLVRLDAAAVTAPDEIAAIRAWNAEGHRPAKNGFTRSVGSTLGVRIGLPGGSTLGQEISSDHGTRIWAGSVYVAGAHRIRLHLKNVVAPPGTLFWVFGTGAPVPFGPELIDEQREVYTPTIDGDIANLEVEVPTGTIASFDITDVLELVGPQQPHDEPSCLVDATCISSGTLSVVDLYRRATAHLQFVANGTGYVCSGGLLNDNDPSGFIPYLLTANHCFSTQAAATSLEAYWDYRTSSCSGSFPSIANSPRSNGSILLATSSSSDFTFVRLNSVPASRAYLGWDTNPPPSGTTLYRISHPFPETFSQPGPQAWSTSVVTTAGSSCLGVPRPKFIYSTMADGGIYGGSSGAPVIIAGGYTVGQLFGACGASPSSGCDVSNRAVDGAFAQTYAAISGFLGAGAPLGCTTSTTTACMLNKRFRVKVRYRAGFDSNAPDTDALVKSVTGFSNPTFETGFFYFNSPDNIEVMVKILDQGNVNSVGQKTIAVLFGSATPLGTEVSITDTLKGGTRTYSSTFPLSQGGSDFVAFVK